MKKQPIKPLCFSDSRSTYGRTIQLEFRQPSDQERLLVWILGYLESSEGIYGYRECFNISNKGFFRYVLFENAFRRLFGSCPKPDWEKSGRFVLRFNRYHPICGMVENGWFWVVSNPCLYFNFISGFVLASGARLGAGRYVVTITNPLTASLVRFMSNFIGIKTTLESRSDGYVLIFDSNRLDRLDDDSPISNPLYEAKIRKRNVSVGKGYCGRCMWNWKCKNRRTLWAQR